MTDPTKRASFPGSDACHWPTRIRLSGLGHGPDSLESANLLSDTNAFFLGTDNSRVCGLGGDEGHLPEPESRLTQQRTAAASIIKAADVSTG
ncbi:hypothetical protein [Burkholderia cepacia]|uniref:hypothetical protein n=1 Tax=Burkholderia cepacia TaxID=292 RepID=UPI0018C89857|nr:hypothetical protein [Burkholderia cepacia]